jgi:hypothetical protein
MKKLLFSMAFLAATALAATAQNKTTVVKDEKTTKPTSTAKEKVHNTFSKHKEHNGTKTTHKKVVEKKDKA